MVIDQSYSSVPAFVKHRVVKEPVPYAIAYLETAELAYLSQLLHERYGEHYSVEGRMLLEIKDDDDKQMYRKEIKLGYSNGSVAFSHAIDVTTG
ncbi:hypothetical protein LTR70_005202 [Exophiala xenobiotica]|uniref:Uncharacterized protein n=1 Tax=Lithohypha guttulata TaxID=1690604 RepID=A0ABR0KCM0_9EURO|nr:hypothetical protein LTR24_004729 [Lithohypha guttulata]KAK5318906.1 hypothetical protein LTR70_005202 [Exophiala xenobiotica]